MKMNKKILLATLLIAVMISGQGHAVYAGTNSNSSGESGPSLTPDFYTGGEDFSVNINYVGPSLFEEASEEADGTYHIETDAQQTNVRVKVDVSGATQWFNEGLPPYDDWAPSFSNIWSNGSSATDGDLVKVNGTVTDTSDIASVTLMYSLNNGDIWNSTAMTGSGVYDGYFNVSSGDQVIYYLTAEDAAGNVGASVADGFMVGSVSSTLPTVSDPWVSPAQPMTGDVATVSANITSSVDLTAANVSMSTNQGGSWTYLPLNVTGYTAGEETTFSMPLGAFPEDANVWFRFNASNANGETNGTTSGFIVPDMSYHVGQLYLIVDGETTKLGGAAALGEVGYDVSLTRGTHVVSFLYAGKDQVEGFKWASDTIIVRVGATGSDFMTDSFEIRDYTMNFDLEDRASQIGEFGLPNQPQYLNISTLEVFFNPIFGSQYLREFSLTPEDNANVSYTHTSAAKENSTTYEPGGAGVIELSDGDEFTVSGLIDTVGFDMRQSVGYDLANFAVDRTKTLYKMTPGHVFYTDAYGVHMVDLSSTDSVDIGVMSLGGETSIQSVVSLVTLTEYGRWDEHQDPYGQVPSNDWDQWPATSSDGSIEVSGSFDFIAAAHPFRFASLDYVAPSQTTIDTTQEDESFVSGFTALAGLLGVGFVAYIAPRMRKEN